ncbi:MAG: hypothetical protein AB1529_06405 [Candidatus Micrarchaeota archaeon]
MALYDEAAAAVAAVHGRLTGIILAPLSNEGMLWAAVPLLVATVFIALYFGRHRKEELGWNTAFGNTMVFLFVGMNLVREIYFSSGSWENVLSSPFYLAIAVALAVTSLLLMLITYFHLLPKKVAFFLFSAPPINVTVYVVMAIVYAGVPPDLFTVAAGIVFLLLILAATKLLQLLVRVFGFVDGAGEGNEPAVSTLDEKVEEELALPRKKRPAKDSVNAPGKGGPWS